MSWSFPFASGTVSFTFSYKHFCRLLDVLILSCFVTVPLTCFGLPPLLLSCLPASSPVTAEVLFTISYLYLCPAGFLPIDIVNSLSCFLFLLPLSTYRAYFANLQPWLDLVCTFLLFSHYAAWLAISIEVAVSGHAHSPFQAVLSSSVLDKEK